jgi:hypothetical protein
MLKLLTDQALSPGGGRVDGLQFADYARVLADVAVGTTGPFAIGVFGEWGTGKTSLLRLVHAELSTTEETNANVKVLPVWFNAWQFEQDEHPIVPLIGTIIHAMERFESSATEEVIGKGLIRALRAIAYGFSAKAKVHVPGLAEIEAGFLAKDMIDREKALSVDPLLDRSLYYQAFDALSKVQLGKGLRIVVLIDDLDRCFPDKAIRLLESIKLVLSQPGFIFILGVAQQVLQGYLKHRYRDEYGVGEVDGGAYLEKIIQLPFTIPPHTGRMEGLANHLLNEADSLYSEQLREIIVQVARHLGDNPRVMVRFINTLLVDSAILKAETPDLLPYLAVTRILQQRWIQFYRFVVADSKISPLILEMSRNNSTLSDLPSRSTLAPAARDLLAADAKLRAFLAIEASRNWLEDERRRNQAIEYVGRSVVRLATATAEFTTTARIWTIVGPDCIEARWVKDAIERRNQRFENHSVYVTRADLTPPSDATVVQAWLDNTRASEKYRHRISLNKPESEQAADAVAVTYLQLLFGL